MSSFEETEAQNAVYDRQIRLWGAEAQKRIVQSRALLCGLGGVNAELCKNLVLAGISVTLVDDAVVCEADLGANFFLEASDVGANRAEACAPRIRELNSFASVESRASSIASCDAAALVAGHSIVCVERSARSAGEDVDCCALDAAARAAGAIFFYVRSDGDGGLAFVDLGEQHTYRVETGSGDTAVISDPLVASFCSFAEMLETPWSAVKTRWSQPPPQFVLDRVDASWRARAVEASPVKKKRLEDGCDVEAYVAFALAELARRGVTVDELTLRRHKAVACAQLSYVCAVLGGILGQEVVKAVAGKGEPTNNLFVFDAATGAGTVLRASPRALAPPPIARVPPETEAIDLE